MYTIFRRTTTGAALGGPGTTSWEVDWKGIVNPALPAIAAFGNFILRSAYMPTGGRERQAMHDRPQKITFAEMRESSA